MIHFSKRNRLRRGGGVGSVFSTLFRTMSPLIKELAHTGRKAMKTKTGRALLDEASKAALNTGLEIANSSLAGENVIKSTKENVGKFGKHMWKKTNDLLDENLQQNRLEEQNLLNSDKPKRRRRKRKLVRKTGGKSSHTDDETEINVKKFDDIFDEEMSNENNIVKKVKINN